MATKTETTKKVEIAKILHKIDALKFGVFKLTQDNTSASDEMDKQEIKQELEKMGVEINPDDLEKVG